MTTATEERERWVFLSNLAEQILATENPPELIRVMGQQILGRVEADTLLNFLVNKSGDALLLNSSVGLPEEIAQCFAQVPCETSICQTLSICSRNFLPNEKCPCGGVLSRLMKEHGIQCFVCHPLVAHSRVIGTLAFGSRALPQFLPDDLDLMRTISAQVSMAIYRMQNEQRLREAEERWRSLSEAAFEGIMIGENGIIIDLNQQLADMVGWPVEELKGREILKFIVPEDWPKVRESFSSDQDRLSEYRVLRKDGSQRIFEVHGRPTWVQGRLRRVTVVRDITERKQLEEELLGKGRELEELNARLEQRVRERTREIEHLASQLRALSVKLIQAEQSERKNLATILHDDVQQLLVASKMRVELCMQNPFHRRNEALCQEANQILHEALEHCRSLVVELHPPLLYQQGLVAALHWLAEHYEQKHRFRVEIEADPRAEPATQELRCLFFDSARELLLNAVKYAQAPVGRVHLCLTPQQEICLSVEDRGKGFDPSQQRNASTSGFGLFSIQQRLAHFGGRMEIDSTPGQGTRIAVWIPIEAKAGQDFLPPNPEKFKVASNP